jgi:hypothetical protein
LSSDIPEQEPFAYCEALARDRAEASAPGLYGDGYRAAALHIAEAIHARAVGRPATALELELRDAEISSRTLRRVVDAAQTVLDDLEENCTASQAIERLLGVFFRRADLALLMPPRSRPCIPASGRARSLTRNEAGGTH